VVPFQATTEDVPATTQVDFYINDSLIGTDSTPSAGIFETTFNSMSYPNGTITLKAVATFDDASTAEKSATVDVDNSGPPMSFITPVTGQAVGGDDVPILISVDDPENPPVSVTFYREAEGTVNLGTDNEAPFEATFDTSDLAIGTPITLRAVGTNAGGESTNVTLSGIVKAVAITVVSAPSDTITFGDSVSFTADVSGDPPSAGTPTGQVQFYIDDAAFGAPVDMVAGQGTSQETSDLEVGVHTVYAEYLGDETFIANTSENWTQTVETGIIIYYYPLIFRILP
jgi:hypothetical protein